MYGSKHTSNVLLFPLCDARGVLMDALQATDNAATTRSDALVFAWRLELPRTVNVAQAASAVLTVALSVPREQWSRQQLIIVRELMVLAGREGALPGNSSSNKNSKSIISAATDFANRPSRRESDSPARSTSDVVSSQGKRRPMADKRHTDANQIRKEESQWWKLVGRTGGDDDSPSDTRRNRSQRKTRTGRVFPER